MVERCFYTAEAVGPIPTPPTTNELDDFLEAEMRDARRIFLTNLEHRLRRCALFFRQAQVQAKLNYFLP